mgnify:FL=1
MNTNSNEIILQTAPVVYIQDRTTTLMAKAMKYGYAPISQSVCLCYTFKEDAEYGESTGFYVTGAKGYTSDSDLTFDEIMDELEDDLIEEYNSPVKFYTCV